MQRGAAPALGSNWMQSRASGAPQRAATARLAAHRPASQSRRRASWGRRSCSRRSLWVSAATAVVALSANATVYVALDGATGSVAIDIRFLVVEDTRRMPVCGGQPNPANDVGEGELVRSKR